ncbi:sigma-54 dependent transcriptional regulator [Desulfobacterales bacterium HSG17]|nr:sigma-54 dependent transcriptional regulator [Desulfobacterales bacterium HSG17]
MKDKMRIMIADDEMIIRESFVQWFRRAGHPVDSAANGIEALEKMEKSAIDLLFADIKMPGMNGIDLLKNVKKEYPDTIVVIITAFGTIETAVEAMKIGAADYLLKPFKPEQLTLVMEKVARQKEIAAENTWLKGELNRVRPFENIIGQSASMEEVFKMIPEVAISDASVLVLGETGTGKELVAKAIHAKSTRNQNPFIAINCGAIPDSLLESELFGHQKGAFTGATQTRKGFLEVVRGGTLFLDEIGEISTRMQVELLRVLDEKKVTRVGSSYPVDVDFRLISATRRNLENRVKTDSFRRDFFYRINVISIHLPPLRKRKHDIPLLASHFLQKYSRETNKKVDHISRDALNMFSDYDWPGNVRELENAVERAVVLSKSRSLGPNDFAFLQKTETCLTPLPQGQRSLKENEKEYIQQVLESCGWNISQSARILDINRVTLHKKIKRFNLIRPES